MIGSNADLAQMKRIREEATVLAEKYRSNTETAIIAGAFMQVVRTLLLQYPEAAREDLTKGAVAFLKGEDLGDEPRVTLQ
jgi:hypothetical protein